MSTASNIRDLLVHNAAFKIDLINGTATYGTSGKFSFQAGKPFEIPEQIMPIGSYAVKYDDGSVLCHNIHNDTVWVEHMPKRTTAERVKQTLDDANATSICLYSGKYKERGCKRTMDLPSLVLPSHQGTKKVQYNDGSILYHDLNGQLIVRPGLPTAQRLYGEIFHCPRIYLQDGVAYETDEYGKKHTFEVGTIDRIDQDGTDIIISTFEDGSQLYTKLVNMTDLSLHIGPYKAPEPTRMYRAQRLHSVLDGCSAINLKEGKATGKDGPVTFVVGNISQYQIDAMMYTLSIFADGSALQTTHNLEGTVQLFDLQWWVDGQEGKRQLEEKVKKDAPTQDAPTQAQTMKTFLESLGCLQRVRLATGEVKFTSHSGMTVVAGALQRKRVYGNGYSCLEVVKYDDGSVLSRYREGSKFTFRVLIETEIDDMYKVVDIINKDKIVRRPDPYQRVAAVEQDMRNLTRRVERLETKPSGKTCKLYRDDYEPTHAMETLLELRRQPGTVPAASGAQWVISWHEIDGSAFVANRVDLGTKRGYLSPCFYFERDAYCAIARIGQQRLKHMFKAFSSGG